MKKNDLNSHSIGIEVFSQAQIANNLKLTQHLMEKHDIPAENVVHHSDWTPGRKFDPSFYWSIESFAKNGCQVYSFNYQNFSQSQIQDFNNKVKQECGFGCLNEESQFKLSFLVSLKQY